MKRYLIEEHTQIKGYTLSSYKKVVEARTIKALVDFQSKNKYLLMAYNQSLQKKMGRIVANHESREADEVIVEYEKYLSEVVECPIHIESNVNMLSHVFGYFSADLSKKEKVYFLDMIDHYRSKEIELSELLFLLHGYVTRFNKSYLMTQTIFIRLNLE